MERGELAFPLAGADLVMIGRAAAAPLPPAIEARLGVPLSDLSEAARSFLHGAGTALAARCPVPDLAALEAALDGYADALTALRRDRLTRDLPGETVGRIFALGFALEQLRRNFKDLGSRSAEFAGSARMNGRRDRGPDAAEGAMARTGRSIGESDTEDQP